MPILEHTPTMRFIPGVRAPAANGLARWYLYQGDRLIVDEHNGAPSIPVAETPQELGLAAVCTEYLGMLEGERPLLCFSGCVEDEATLPNGFAAYDLRALSSRWTSSRSGCGPRQAGSHTGIAIISFVDVAARRPSC